MTFKILARAALVIPEQARRGSRLLGPGSIVRVLEGEDAESPLGCDELPIICSDVSGAEMTGWLASSTMFSAATPKHEVLSTARDDLDINAVDRVRDLVACARLRDPKAGWTIRTWCSIFGHAHLPELYAAIRELGARYSPSDHPDTTISRLISLITHQEVTMAEVQETRETEGAVATAPKASAKKGSKATSKKASAKGASKAEVKASGKAAKAADTPVARKVAKEPEVPARSMAHTVGAALLPLLKRAKADPALVAIAEKLEANANVSAKQLGQLRDGVNACAQAAREKEKADLASELSAVNKLVRRLQRKAAA